jgi:hypothetical protein
MASKHNGRKRSQRRNKKNRVAAFAVVRETYVYIPDSKGAARKFEKEMKDQEMKDKGIQSYRVKI